MENIITHLLVVQFSSFQRHNLIFYQLASVGTQEKAAHTTTGGEGSWDRSEIEDADFFVVDDVGDLGRQWWTARRRQRVR